MEGECKVRGTFMGEPPKLQDELSLSSARGNGDCEKEMVHPVIEFSIRNSVKGYASQSGGAENTNLPSESRPTPWKLLMRNTVGDRRKSPTRKVERGQLHKDEIERVACALRLVEKSRHSAKAPIRKSPPPSTAAVEGKLNTEPRKSTTIAIMDHEAQLVSPSSCSAAEDSSSSADDNQDTELIQLGLSIEQLHTF